MKDLGCTFGCVEGCFFSVTNIGWTFCVQEMYFSFSNPLCEFYFVTFAIWGMGLYKKECTLCLRYPFLSACRPVSESMRIIKRHIFALE